MNPNRFRAAAILALATLGAAAHAQDSYNFSTIVSGGLSTPVGVYFAPGDQARMFVIEQVGRIRIYTIGGTPTAPTYTLLTTPFLDLAALDTANPYFRNTGGTPLSDQSGTVIPRLIRSGGLPISSGGNNYAVSRYNEQGLLGMAFAPDFVTSGKVYINYTQNNPNMTTGAITWSLSGNGTTSPFTAQTSGRTAIMEFTIDPANPNQVLASSEKMVLSIPQPFVNHNGGCIHFGPDGNLWIGMGDGGSGNDPNNDALDPNELLGKMLRINPAADDFPADNARNYAIPAGNAYPGGVGGRAEVWSRGMRNPWRFSFDRWNGDLWIADVGQGLWEEVNRVPYTSTALNFGWRVREGFASTTLAAGGFDISSLTPPLYVYPHGTTQAGTNNAWTSTQVGISITGGYTYRGNIRALRGRYIFADYLTARIQTLPANLQPTPTGWLGTPAQAGLVDITTLLTQQTGQGNQTTPSAIVSFGQDNLGELYMVEQAGGGRIRKIIAAGVQPLLADIAGANQSTTPDGVFTADDIIVFLGWFFANDPRADIAGPNQSSLVDQALTADDIIVFLSAYFDGR